MRYTILCLLAVLAIACSSEPEEVDALDVNSDSTEVAIADTTRSDSAVIEDVMSGVLPAYSGLVNDYKGILTAGQSDTLQRIIESHLKRTGNQIVLVLVEDYGRYLNADSFLEDLDRSWTSKSDNPDQWVIVLMNRVQGELRISAGEKVQKLLSQEEVDRITIQGMFPYFQNAQYYEGLSVGLVQIAELLESKAKLAVPES